MINSELWHACAGPLVSLPPVGSLVVYFPQGHSEQVRFRVFSLQLLGFRTLSFQFPMKIFSLYTGRSIYAEAHRWHPKLS